MSTQHRILWTALLGLAVGASALHFKIHPPTSGRMDFLANVGAALDLVVVSILFLNRGTAVWGLLLNSFLAFLGIILMADYSIDGTIHGFMKFKPHVNFIGWLLETTFADIMILLADFLVGIALYNSIMTGGRIRT